MGLVKLTPTEPNYRWDMLNERKYGGISCISTWDVTGDGLADIIVGRDDGVVEVYGFEDTDEPRLKFSHVSTCLYIPLAYKYKLHYAIITYCTVSILDPELH